MPSYYIPEVKLSDQFYESFLIELVLGNESRGEILSMGGKDLLDGFTLRAEGNQMQFVISNKGKLESVQLNAFFRGGPRGWGGIPGMNEKNTLKHHIFWNSSDRKIHYMIDGYDVAELDFEGPLGRGHTPLVIGGDTSSHNYGSAKIYSFKIWDKSVQKDQISGLSTIDSPIFELNLKNPLKGVAFNVLIDSEESNVDRANETIENKSAFLRVENYENESLLLQAFLMKSAAEYLDKNFDESAKYMKKAFKLNQGENNDRMQYQLASLLLENNNDSEIKSYMNKNQMAKSINWKLEYIMDSLTGKNPK